MLLGRWLLFNRALLQDLDLLRDGRARAVHELELEKTLLIGSELFLPQLNLEVEEYARRLLHRELHLLLLSGLLFSRFTREVHPPLCVDSVSLIAQILVALKELLEDALLILALLSILVGCSLALVAICDVCSSTRLDAVIAASVW